MDGIWQSASLFTLVPLRIGSGMMFHLKAELELDADERQLMMRYKFSNAPIVVSDPIDDLKKSIRPATILGLVAFVVFWWIGSFTTAMSLAILVTLVMTVVYFKTLREQILVSDLLNGGRTFRCDSVVELIHKEAFLEGVCEYLRQVLESAKNWHDREIIPIKPMDKALAKEMVLRASNG